MYSIRHPQRTWFGLGAISKIKDEAEFLGARNALFLTDKGVRGAGVADMALDPLKEAGVEVTIYDGCPPEPRHR